MRHTLAGKYIVFRYTECDHEGEGSALCLFRLWGKKLLELYHPRNGREAHEIDYTCYDEMLKIMRAKKITTVCSVFHKGDFFGVPSGCYSLQDEITDPSELWAEYEPISDDDNETENLKSDGIDVELYFDPSYFK